MKTNTPNLRESTGPYSLSVRGASAHFGYSAQTIYDLIYKGELVRGVHYLKLGKKVVIVVEMFIHWMIEKDGSNKEN